MATQRQGEKRCAYGCRNPRVTDWKVLLACGHRLKCTLTTRFRIEPVLASRVTEIGSSEAFHEAIQIPCPGSETGLQLIGRPKNPASLRLEPAPTVEGLGSYIKPQASRAGSNSDLLGAHTWVRPHQGTSPRDQRHPRWDVIDHPYDRRGYPKSHSSTTARF